MKLEGRVALITGAASGMGKAVANMYAKEGAFVAAVDINPDGLATTVSEITSFGGIVQPFACDVSESRDVQRLVAAVVENYKRIDILYNNAALPKKVPPVPETVAEMPEDHWYAVLNTNLSGYYLCAKYVIQVMLQSGHGGVILNVSSTAGIVAGGQTAAYSTSKAGIISLTRSMAAQYAGNGIRVNAICPGPIDTPRFRGTADPLRGSGEDRVSKRSSEMPIGRIGIPDDVAKLAVFLASDDASFITGAWIPIDGGSLLQAGGGGPLT